jgi:hypothetical protein
LQGEVEQFTVIWKNNVQEHIFEIIQNIG